MTLAYHSGLSSPQRTVIAAQLVTALAALPYVKFAGRIMTALESTDDEAWAQFYNTVRGQMPAVVVALDEEKFVDNGMTGARERARSTLRAVIYVATNHRGKFIVGRTEQDSLSAADDALDPGTDAILEQVQDVTVGVEFTADTIYRMVPKNISSIVSTAKESVWALEFTVELERNRDTLFGQTERLERIRVTGDVLDGGAGNPITDHQTDIDP